MSARAPLRIVVVGGGAAATLTAAALGRALTSRVAGVRLVETSDADGDLGALGGGESSLPQLRQLHAILGLDERELMARADGAFKLGADLRGWSGPGSRFAHPLGECGATIDAVAFHHYWGRLGRHEAAAPLEDYSLGAAAGKLGKFASPVSDPSSVMSTIQYALNLDGILYADALRDYARSRGVACSRGELAHVGVRAEDGFVEALVLAGGERVEGDLFVDCTGARARLVGEALGVGFEDWSHWLPCDRFAVASCAPQPNPAPLTPVVAQGAGWRWTVPLNGSTGEVHAFSSAYAADDDVIAALARDLGDAMREPPRVTAARSGRRRRAWEKNCVAIGAAAGFLEPFAGASLHLAQSGVTKLIGLLPDASCTFGEREEYDRLMSAEHERVRDFLIQHYAGARRDDSDFWRDRRAVRPPESLLQKTELFEARGGVVMHDEELFDTPDWVSVLVGQGVRPRRYDPLADRMPLDALQRRLGNMRTLIDRAAAAMPTHRAFLDAMARAEPGPRAALAGQVAP